MSLNFVQRQAFRTSGVNDINRDVEKQVADIRLKKTRERALI